MFLLVFCDGFGDLEMFLSVVLLLVKGFCGAYRLWPLTVVFVVAGSCYGVFGIFVAFNGIFEFFGDFYGVMRCFWQILAIFSHLCECWSSPAGFWQICWKRRSLFGYSCLIFLSLDKDSWSYIWIFLILVNDNWVCCFRPV